MNQPSSDFTHLLKKINFKIKKVYKNILVHIKHHRSVSESINPFKYQIKKISYQEKNHILVLERLKKKMSSSSSSTTGSAGGGNGGSLDTSQITQIHSPSPDHLLSPSDQLCYVQCSFCDTVLAVSHHPLQFFRSHFVFLLLFVIKRKKD